MSNDINNQIDLTLPINAAYVSAARLTSSSVANRMGFEIDEIEDIKAAVSEASTYIIKHHKPNSDANLHITFFIQEITMTIQIIVENSEPIVLDNDDMGLIMIKALMEDFKLEYTEENALKITMSKKHKNTSFD